MRGTTCVLLACVSLGAQAQKAIVPPQKKASRPSTASRRPVATPVVKPTAPPAESRVTVMVRAESTVAGGTFTLGEVADITGSDRTLIKQLAAVPIGTSPLPGLARPMMPGDFTVRLRAAHLEQPNVQVVTPPTIRVSRAANNVASDEITRAALAAAQTAFADRPEITLEPSQAIPNITLPSGKFMLMAGAYRGQGENGTITVPISLLVDGKVVQTVDVPLRVHRKLKAVVARREIQPNELLSPNDVQVLLVELPPGFTQPILDVKAIAGKRARRRLIAESPISAAALETPPAITANAAVTIEYIFGTIHITASGVARQAGAIGETIRIYASDTKKELDAVIVDSHTVRIGEEEKADDSGSTAEPSEPESENHE